jgi:TFIIF-interacting CTD phosphatase-like protein
MTRLHLVLDLDETLLHSVTVAEYDHNRKLYRKYRCHRMPDSDFWVIERPGVQRFLDTVCRDFDLSVWTAASQSYAAFIMKHVVQADSTNRPGVHSRRPLHYALCSYHCELARDMFGSETLKDLRFFSKLTKAGCRTRTVILDDHPGVFATQPHNCIQVRPFLATTVDNELMHFVLPALQRLAKTGEVFPGTRLGEPIPRATIRPRKPDAVAL